MNLNKGHQQSMQKNKVLKSRSKKQWHIKDLVNGDWMSSKEKRKMKYKKKKWKYWKKREK